MKSLKNYFFYHAILFVFLLCFIQCENKVKPQKDGKKNLSANDKTNQREQPKLVYDTNGNIIERHANSYRSDNTIRSVDSYFYKYDKRNNLTEETKESYSPEGVLDYKNVNLYTYNNLNQKIEQKFSNYKEGKLQLLAKNTYSYNTKGEIIEEKSYYENGVVKSIINTARTDAGDLKSEEYIDFDQEGTKTSHKKYHYTKLGLERTEDLMIK